MDRGGTALATGTASVDHGDSQHESKATLIGSLIGQKTKRKLWLTLAAGLAVLAAGPLASASAAPSVTIDTPAANALTKERSPTIAGSTSDTLDSVSVSVYAGAGTGGTRVRDESVAPFGNGWTLPGAPLADGTYTAVAQQSESGTPEVGSSPEVTFTVDATAPVVTLEPVASATNKSTVALGGSAGTEPRDLETVAVIVYAGSSAAGQEVLATSASVHSGQWSISPTLADGLYTVEAFQEDEARNLGTSVPATFRVDTVAPAPLSLNAVSSVSSNSAPTFSGAGGETSGDEPVRVLLDGKIVDEAPVSAGAWKYVPPHLPDGSYTVRAEQLDEAGNVSQTNVASFRIDTKGPTLAIATPKAGPPLTSSKVTFSGTTSNSLGDLPTVTIQIFDGPAVAGSAAEELPVTREGSSWTSAGANLRLSNGQYTARAVQQDSAGNPGASPPVTFSIESPAPGVTLNGVQRFLGDATPEFAGTAEASAEAKPEVTLKVWRGSSTAGTPVRSVTVPAGSGAWASGPIQALPEDTYTAQAEQPAEAGGNPAGVSKTTTFTIDTAAPVPTLSAAPESSGLETVSGVAGTAVGDRRQVTSELFAGAAAEPGQAIEAITVNAAADGTWAATFAGLSGGQYTVLAHQSDEAGNTGTSAPQSFTVLAPPAAPAAGPSPPIASFTWVPANPTVGQSVSLASNSTGGSTPLSGFGWDVGGGQFAAGGALLSTSFATPGPHVVRLQVSDADGLSSIAAHTINVAAQALKLMQPFPIVRIAGSETSTGARVKLLTVQAPPTTKVSVSCKGPGCKTKAESRIATASSKSRSKTGAISLSFPRFQRALRAGAVLQIRVSKAGEIGKFTSFTIRRNKLPTRVDACLRPPSSSPSPCPSS
jgi:hypothetical protein